MTIDIHIAQPDDANEWDKINSKSPHGTIFHQWDWLKITEKHTNSTLYPLIGLKGSTIIGIFPLFFQKKGPIRMVFSPPPHAALFYLGPVFVGHDTIKQEKREIIYIEFQNSVENFITNNLKANYIRISLSPALQDPRPFIWSGYIFESQYDYVVDLRNGIDYLLQTLDKRGRQNLNHAKKKGITIEIGGRKEYETILHLMDIRYKQQGKIITVSKNYFFDIYDTFHNNLKIFVAKLNDQVVTGSIDFQYRDTYYSWIGNPKPKNRISPSPNDLLIWESVRYAYEQEFKYYVTMNAAGNKRLHSYYASKFNPTLKAHFSLKKNSPFAGVLEDVYINITKPLKGQVRYQLYGE
jgi:hypothetical protein